MSDSDKYELIILFDGYNIPSENGTKANCTCTLLKSPTNLIIIDTRTSWDGPALIEALKANNVDKDDINYCICTHGHSDHVGCNYLFKNALQIVGKNCISKRDLYHELNLDEKPYIIDKDIQVIATPGHTSEDISVLAQTTQGLVAIVGDLFEKEEDLQDENLWKDSSEFPEMQAKSRQMVLNIADYIVPGHGPIFKNLCKTL